MYMRKIFLLFIAIIAVIFVYNLFDLENVEVEPVTLPGQNQVVNVEPEVQEESQEVRVPEREICVGEYCDGSMLSDDPSSEITALNIPLITSEGDIGCREGLIFAPHTVPKTQAVLDATYKTLFDIKFAPEILSDDVRNIVALEEELFYRGVSLDSEGTARVLLEGEATVIYNCTIPTFRAQIEQAALQYDTVNTLEVYLNNEQWDWCDFSQADPEEDGCDVTPKYWVATK